MMHPEAWRYFNDAAQAYLRALYMEDLRDIDQHWPADTAWWTETYQRLLDLKAAAGKGMHR